MTSRQPDCPSVGRTSAQASDRPDQSPFDVYDLISGSSSTDLPRASQIAERIVDDLASRGWPVGESIGSERNLASRYRVGPNVMRQTLRMLEARGIGKIRPGPSGGLIVTQTSRDELVGTLSRTLRLAGVETADIGEAISLICRHGDGPASTDGERRASVCSLVLDALQHFAAEKYLLDGFGDTTSHKGTQAIQIATALMAELSRERCVAGYRLGSVSQLSERYNVDARVLAQAIRLISDLGIAQVRRGRNGGIFFRDPGCAAQVRFVHSQLAAQRLNAKDVHQFIWRLNIIHVRRAAERGTATESLLAAEQDLMSTSAEQMLYAWIKLQREIAYAAGLPALHMLCRCFAGFDIRTAIDLPARSQREANDVRAAAHATVRAILSQDGDGAERAQMLCHSLIDDRLSEGPAHSRTLQ